MELGGAWPLNKGGARLKYAVGGSAPYMRRAACAGFFVSGSDTIGAKSYIPESLSS